MVETKKHALIIIIITALFSMTVALFHIDKESRIYEILHDQLRYNEATYKQGLDRFSVIADNIYLSIENDPEFLKIVASAKDGNLTQAHKRLYAYYKNEFHKLRQLEVMGLQVVTPQTRCIVRMHKEDRFGDDLSKIRYSLAYVNEYKTRLSGFEEGRTSHAFRVVYPLFLRGEYIGAMEILFSSTMLQNYSMRASNMHTHFIVNKNVFKTNAWKSNITEPYEQSIEHKGYLFSMSDHINHERLDYSNKTLITPLREEINEGIASGEEFAVYKKIDDRVRVVAFLPVKRMKDNKTVAYFLSYTDSDEIYTILKYFKIIVYTLVVLFILIYVVIYKMLKDKHVMETELQYDGLTNILNRKYFLNIVQDKFEALKTLDDEFSIVMADIDFFKKVNDTYGHQVGDIVLQEIANILKESVRSIDKVSRYGGEEFIILLYANRTNAYHIVDNIRKKIEQHSFAQEYALSITASFGIAQYELDESLDALIKRADRALYESKENGRNQVNIL